MMMILNDSISSSSSPTFWSSLTNWFTPTIFFLLLQLVIATIYITSNLTHHKHQNHQEQHHHHHHHHQQQHPLEPNNFFFQHQNPIPRSPSLLHRLKSINFYYHHHHEHQEPQQHQHEHHHQQEHPLEPNNLFQQQNPLPRSPSLLQRLKSINFYYHHEHHEHQQQQNQPPPPQILRSPSSMLQKLKSINLYSYLPTDPMSYFTTDTNRTHHEKTHVREIETAPGKSQQYQSEEEDEEEEENDVVGEINWTNNNNHIESELGNSTMDEIFSRLQEGQNGNFSRTNSDTKPSSGEVPVKLARKMKKSASTKSAFSHFEEVDIVERRRPATVKEGSAAAVTEEGDGGVDAKADDFINRFKQQLKLQRLDSIMRYKEMLGRGTGK